MGEPWEYKWKIKYEITSGGQGVIYRVESLEDKKDGVLKTIVDRWKDDPQAHERLKNEKEVLEKLNNLGVSVPKVLDDNLEKQNNNNSLYFVMDYIPGPTLKDYIEKQQGVSLKEALRITKKIADIIKTCHDNKIIHRDIKPLNIIIRDIQGLDIVVVDFGISYDSMQTIFITKEGELFWNEFIRLPECQDLAGKNRDIRSDVCALCGILFYCITAKSPNIPQDGAGLLPHMREGINLSEIIGDSFLAEQLERLFSKGFRHNIDERYQNLEELLYDINIIENPNYTSKLDFYKEYKSVNERILRQDDQTKFNEMKRIYNNFVIGVSRKIAKTRQINEMNFQAIRVSIDQVDERGLPNDKQKLGDVELHAFSIRNISGHYLSVIFYPVANYDNIDIYISRAWNAKSGEEWNLLASWELCVSIPYLDDIRTILKKEFLIDMVETHFCLGLRDLENIILWAPISHSNIIIDIKNKDVNMKISEMLNKVYLEPFSIRKNHIEEVLDKPDNKQSLEFGDLALNLYMGTSSKSAPSTTLIVIERIIDKGQSEIDAVYKTYLKPLGISDDIKPFEILKILAERFGVGLKVLGKEESKFIGKDTIPIPPGTTSVEIIQPSEKVPMVNSFYIRITKEKTLEVAFAFALKTYEYQEWLDNQKE